MAIERSPRRTDGDHDRLVVGWFSFTCCEDSTILFTELLNDYLDAWKKVVEFSGLLYHMAQVDEEEMVEYYDVIIPKAQNQINIENDLRDYFSRNLQRGEDALRMNAESIIHAYDPCMSCATNFLKIEWIRE